VLYPLIPMMSITQNYWNDFQNLLVFKRPLHIFILKLLIQCKKKGMVRDTLKNLTARELKLAEIRCEVDVDVLVNNLATSLRHAAFSQLSGDASDYIIYLGSF
jgi:hypothetical protein